MRVAIRTLLIAAFVAVTAAPAFAQEVDFRIVGFGEQDCRSGSTQLNTGEAITFTIEVCVDDGSGPANLEEVIINISHADGSIETRDKLTVDGIVRFDITPLDAGLTTVEVCALGTCHGTVTMQADSPPHVAEATYFGPTADMGLSMPLMDPADDFFDPYEGADGGPGFGDPTMDITQVVYLGIVNGRATYEVTTVGDVCSRLMDPTTPFIQMSATISTPDGGDYLVGVRRQNGAEQQSAFSNGAALGGSDVDLACEGNQATLSASNVDVPEGSFLTFLGWLSLDSTGSGFQDYVEGPLVVAPPPESPPPSDDPTDGGSTEDDVTALPVSSDDGSSGSFPIWIPILVGGVLVGGYFLYRSSRPDSVAMSTGVADVTDADLAQYADGDLGSYTDVYAAAGTAVATTDSGLWPALLGREEDIQSRYLGDFRDLLSAVAQARRDYKAAIDQYHETFVKVASGSTGLQGYLQQWSENKETAEKQDIAWGIISVVWGVGALGWKMVKWVRHRSAVGAVAAATDDVADAVKIVDEANDMKRFDALAAEMGMTGDEWLAQFGGLKNFTEADRVLRNAVGLKRGWHPITRNAEDLIGRLLVNGRSAVAGRGATIDPADVAKLQEWASAPGFWEKLPLSAVNLSYDIVGSPGGRGPAGDAIALIYDADDVQFLRRLLAVDGDTARLADALGPAQVAAWEFGVGAVGTGINAGDLGSDVMSLSEGSSLVGGLDLGSYTDQFGGWTSSVESGFWTAQAEGLWSLFTSPFETFSSLAHTYGAQSRYMEFLEGHGDDLTDLGASLKAAIDALDRMADAIDRADLDDATSALGGRLADDLRALLGEMEGHEGYEERRAHVEQKIADIERISGGLQDQMMRIRQMRDWIEGLFTDHEGNLRPVIDLWNPEILSRLGAGDLMLSGIVGSAASGGRSPLPKSAPANQAPPPMDIFSEDYDPLGHLDPTDDSDDWSAELDGIFGSD